MDDVLGVCHVNHDIIRGSTHECRPHQKIFGVQNWCLKSTMYVCMTENISSYQTLIRSAGHILTEPTEQLSSISQNSPPLTKWGVDQGKFQNGRICNCIGRLTANFKGCLQLEEDWLAEEELPGLEAQAPDLRLCQLNILPWPRSPHCNKNIKLKTNYLGIWWSMGKWTLVALFLWWAEQSAYGKLMKSMAVAKVWRHTMAVAYWQGVQHQ